MSVQTNLTFLADLSLYKKEKPYVISLTTLDPKVPLTNCKFVNKQVLIRDARKLEACCSFDTTGFMYISHSSHFAIQLKDADGGFNDDLVYSYLQETIELMKEQFGTGDILVIDWRVGHH
jgi:hypothetical protein